MANTMYALMEYARGYKVVCDIVSFPPSTAHSKNDNFCPISLSLRNPVFQRVKHIVVVVGRSLTIYPNHAAISIDQS